MRTIKRRIVAAVIVSADGKILQVKKNPARRIYETHMWMIPGGGVEEGEGLETALIREMEEELGIDITPYPRKFLDLKRTGSSRKLLKTGEEVMCDMEFYEYKIDIDRDADEIEIVLDKEELSEYAWHAPEEIKKLSLTPPSKDLYERLAII